jgi:prepilin-type N-terminal cleavage/methylation domain-containing protein
MYKKHLFFGFTLIELMTVIAIIGALSAILLAKVAEARNKAKNVVITQTVREYVNAVRIYQNDHDGYLPVGQDTTFAPGLRYCLGHAPNGSTCFTGIGNYQGVEDPVLNAILDDYYPTLASPNPDPIKLDDSGIFNNVDGSIYWCTGNILNGPCYEAELHWNLYTNSANCNIAGAEAYPASYGTTCVLRLERTR